MWYINWCPLSKAEKTSLGVWTLRGIAWALAAKLLLGFNCFHFKTILYSDIQGMYINVYISNVTKCRCILADPTLPKDPLAAVKSQLTPRVNRCFCSKFLPRTFTLLRGPVQDEGSAAGCSGQPGGWETSARGLPARERMEQLPTCPEQCTANPVECLVQCRKWRSKPLWLLQLI